jgi:hypothetical protein
VALSACRRDIEWRTYAILNKEVNMARFEHDGMVLWYGTEDAPAPADTVAEGASQSVIIGIQPPDASYRIELRYRLNQGPVESIPAAWLRNDLTNQAQYFEAQFPAFSPGDSVEYTPVCNCVGRQVPCLKEPIEFISSFRVIKADVEQNPALARAEMPPITATAADPRPDVISLSSPGDSKELSRVLFNTQMMERAPGLQQPTTLLQSDKSDAKSALSVSTEVAQFNRLETLAAKSQVAVDKTMPSHLPSDQKLPLSMIAGKFTIVTNDISQIVSKQDFLFYDLSVEFSESRMEDVQILHYPFTDDIQIQDNSTVLFSFPDSQLSLYDNVVSPVWVKVKSFDGSLLWSREYQANDQRLAYLEIKVPLQKPVILVSADKRLIHDKAKKLRGQVLEFGKECALKDLTVVIQAKAPGDTLWRIVGAGTTDCVGNFSMPYPFGVFTEAQALVSVTPNSPAAMNVTAVRNGDQTIADDFLYLLINDLECPHVDTKEDCDCQTKKKVSRLPDQADLIGSDEYSQDIGGSCVNLSTPNRTLSEFNYQAIVRTSDPDVANYTLKKVDVAQPGIALVLLSEISRSVSALDSAVRNPIFGKWYDSQKLRDAYAKIDAMRSISANASSADITTALNSVDAIIYLFNVIVPESEIENYAAFKAVQDNARELKAHLQAALVPRTETHYELVGGAEKRERKRVDLDNPVAWQDDDQHLSLYQAVTVATGHILHYKSEIKADGYSLGELIYSLPLAPGQKKQIVVFDSSHRLVGAESQALSQGERLTAGIVDEREIVNQLGGSITESLRGSSSANTSGISAGFGTGGSGYGGGTGYGGSGSAVLGIAGGVANANSNASQDSSRNISQFFQEKLRQSIMQNADSYRQLNASVVTTVQEGQQYGVTSEVVANHNHCHALTMMYFEVLRHYAIFQKLSSVEECVFVPLLMTNFTAQNIYKWRDVLAKFLLPMPAETYLQSFNSMSVSGSQHPLLKAFDANERIKTNYANVDYPEGAYDDERIQFIRGNMRIRVELPRPRTRFDRIMSLPITTQTFTTKEIDPEATAAANLDFARRMAEYSAKQAAIAPLTFGLSLIVDPPPHPPGLQYTTTQHEVLVRQAIFDAFMSLDANYQSVPPAECIRVVNFKPPATISIGPLGSISPTFSILDFFADNDDDKKQWTIYANLLGYTDVLTMLNAYFKGNLISEWDAIFYNDIAPLIFEKIVSDITLSEFSTDFSSETKYKGGERVIRLNLTGSTSKKRNQLPQQLNLTVRDQKFRDLKNYITFNVENLTISYSTAHYNGVLYSGNVNDDLFDDTGAALFIPENAEEKRSPRKEDAYLVYKLLEHLNSSIEYYNKALWYNLDPDRRFMLLDGFNIQNFNDFGLPIGSRSLASVVKNELITITGNSLVFPVAAGYKVSQSYIVEQIGDGAEIVSLLDHYQPLTPIEPYRISVPTKGVFAEAVQGVCNACEKIETDRLQDWTRFPNTDEPTAISPVTPPTPVVTDWQAAFKDFATPIVNIQNAPASPAPGAGLAGLSELLGKSGVFKDITGLDANQQNVLRTYLSNQENAKAFGEMAKEMAMQQHNTQNSGSIMDSITAAKNSGDITKQEAGQLVKDHLQQQIDGGETKKAELEKEKRQAIPSVAKAGVDAINRGGTDVTATTADPSGFIESVTVKNSALADSVTSQGFGSSASEQAYQAVVELLGKPSSPSGDDFYVVVDKLKQLEWSDLSGVLEQLASKGPSLDGMTWLELFNERTKDMIVDDRVLAATKAILIAHGGRTISTADDVEGAGSLGQLMLRLKAVDQIRILERLGFRDEAAEGAIASIYAAAVAAGLVQLPNALAMAAAPFDFGDWDPPGNQDIHFYVGNAVHEAIANYYKGRHPSPSHLVFTNTINVQTIADKIASDFGSTPDKIARALGERKPDIFEYSTEHLPPMFAYEIKPWAWGEIGLAKVAVDCAALHEAGVGAVPGPQRISGTQGVVPAPNGWAVFESPAPGLIVYQVFQASQVEIDARDQARGRKSQKVNAVSLRGAVTLTAASVGLYEIAAAIIELLLERGFILALL